MKPDPALPAEHSGPRSITVGDHRQIGDIRAQDGPHGAYGLAATPANDRNGHATAIATASSKRSLSGTMTSSQRRRGARRRLGRDSKVKPCSIGNSRDGASMKFKRLLGARMTQVSLAAMSPGPPGGLVQLIAGHHLVHRAEVLQGGRPVAAMGRPSSGAGAPAAKVRGRAQRRPVPPQAGQKVASSGHVASGCRPKISMPPPTQNPFTAASPAHS